MPQPLSIESLPTVATLTRDAADAQTELQTHATHRSEVAQRSDMALRSEVAARLEQHRRRRSATHSTAQDALPGMDTVWPSAAPRPNRVATSVAARFAQRPTYRDLLQQEAAAATQQAEAAAEIARRNAQAIAAAEEQLLRDMARWDAAADAVGPVEIPTAVIEAAPLPVALAAENAAVPATTPAPPALRIVEPALTAPSIAEFASVAAPTAEASAAPVDAFFTSPAEPPAFSLPPAPLEPTTPLPTNLLEFPRQLVAARKARPRHAEGPLREDADAAPERAQLRIFEVEASTFSTTPAAEPATSLPEWSSIRLDGWAETHELTHPDAQVSTALPVYAAPIERRIMSALVDSCCIATAFIAAVGAAGLAGDALPTGLFAAAAAVATLAVFTLGYLVLCFSLSGQTVGMRYARIALCTFGDDNPSRSAMRRRLLATALSAVSLGLGFAWAMLDDDKLGWHDRISRMYQRAY